MAEEPGLQFDHAEFAGGDAPKLACGACKKPILEAYFQLGQSLFCATCKAGLGRAFQGGSGFIRFLRACAFGGVVGFAGAAVYAFTLWAMDVNFALVTIFIGVFVGKAVRRGSEHRGGLTYQLLAVFITYVSMAIAFAPLYFAGYLKHKAPTQSTVAASPATASGAATPHKELPEGVEQALIAMICVAMALGKPIFDLRSGDILSLLIFGFGLYEAWKANRKLVLDFKGPFAVARPVTAAATT